MKTPATICPRCHQPRPHICYGAHMRYADEQQGRAIEVPPVVQVAPQGALLAVETKQRRIDD